MKDYKEWEKYEKQIANWIGNKELFNGQFEFINPFYSSSKKEKMKGLFLKVEITKEENNNYREYL